MKLVLLGAPGAGKGTQAEIISKQFQIPAISTGAIIRKAMKEKTPLGDEAEKYMKAGQLVPDNTVIAIIQERLKEDDCRNGFILDGFPRTIKQAQALYDMGVHVDVVLNIEVADEVIVERLSGRRQCPHCGLTYHVTDKPSKDGITCDNCGEKLTVREDDEPETVRERLHVYHNQTEKLIDFYEQKKVLKTVYGKQTVEDTTKEVLRALEVQS